MILRYYQNKAVVSPFEYWQEKEGNPVIAMPTGTGKSVVIGDFNRRAVQAYPQTRILNLTHVKELVKQNHDKLLELWPTAPAGILSAGLKRKDFGYPITFAGIGSIHRHAEKFRHTNIVTIDECHTVSPKESTTYFRFLKELKQYNPKLKVLGLTATPYRMGQGMIVSPGSIFTDICYDLTSMDAFNQLLDEGYLCPLIPKQMKVELDVSGVRTVSGDYNLQDLQAACDKESITRAALEEMIELGTDRKSWLIFTSGIEHAEHVAAMLGQMGISAIAIHSKSSNEFRDSGVEMFKKNQIRALVNNGCFTTGFDFSGIDLIGILRPTQSPGLWVQMLGRGTRPIWPDSNNRAQWENWGAYDLSTNEGRLACIAEGPKQNCLVLDFAGNTRKLGPVNDPRIPNKKKKGGPQDAPVKTCEQCQTFNHTSARFCIMCKAEFPPPKFTVKGKAFSDELITRGKVNEPPEQIDFDVDLVTYERHESNPWRFNSNFPSFPSLKITYSCGLRKFSEFLNVEHTGDFARDFVRQWWKRASNGSEIPLTVADALRLADTLTPAKSIRVWTNKKPKPEILFRSYE